MTNIEILKYHKDELIEKNTISNLNEKINQNRELLSRLCDFMTIFMPNNNVNLEDVIDDLQEYDSIIIEMRKE